MGDQLHREMLARGVEQWNAWRESNPETTPDLRGEALTNLDLSGVNLAGARLAQARFFAPNGKKSVLTEARLDAADLTGADLRAVDLEGASLTRVILVDADLSLAYLKGADLSGANLKGASFRGISHSAASNLPEPANMQTVLAGANLTDADLRNALLCGADLSQAVLIRAQLQEADLSAASLEGADLSHADLSRAHLRNANLQIARADNALLSDAYITGAIMGDAFDMDTLRAARGWRVARYSKTRLATLGFVGDHNERVDACDFSGLVLRKADFRGVNLGSWSFLGSRLQHADFCDACLRDADLRDADLAGARLERANLQGTKLEGANIQAEQVSQANNWVLADLGEPLHTTLKKPLIGPQGVSPRDLAGAKLAGLSLRGANLTMANLRSASLRGADLREACLLGANLQEADLADADLRGANLMEAKLNGANLQGADLREMKSLTPTDLESMAAILSNGKPRATTPVEMARNWKLARFDDENCNFYSLPSDHNDRVDSKNFDGYDFRGQDLRGAVLAGANLSRAELEGADLRGANLRDAELRGANLKGARMFATELRNADLQDADLSTSRDLLSEALSGTNLSGAKLPETMKEFKGVAHVDEACKNAGKQFDLVVAAYVVCWLMIQTTSHATLLTNGGSLTLPVVGITVKSVSFFGWAPVLLLGLHAYFLLSVQRYWEALIVLPAYFPDGTPLDRRVHPWLMSCFVRRFVKRLQTNSPPLIQFQIVLCIISGWLLVPITLCAIWWKYLPLRDWGFGTVGGTACQLLMLALSLLGGSAASTLMVLTLRRDPDRLSSWVRPSRNRELFSEFGWALLVLVCLLLVSACVIQVPSALSSAIVHLDLAGEDLSARPAGWTGTLSVVKGADLHGRHLEWANATRTFLVRANMEGVSAIGIDLTRADLREADLGPLEGTGPQGEGNAVPADLRFANLSLANLEGASLRGAHLGSASFRKARMAKCQLSDADLRQANLSDADLSNADLRSADLRGTNLSGARLTEAKLEAIRWDAGTRWPEGYGPTASSDNPAPAFLNPTCQ